jgi:hypothetical protein
MELPVKEAFFKIFDETHLYSTNHLETGDIGVRLWSAVELMVAQYDQNINAASIHKIQNVVLECNKSLLASHEKLMEAQAETQKYKNMIVGAEGHYINALNEVRNSKKTFTDDIDEMFIPIESSSKTGLDNIVNLDHITAITFNK